MAGYTRQSSASIITGEDITAAPLNAEFNTLETAFGTSGHVHDGTAGNGPKISLTGSVSGNLPLANIATIGNYTVLGNVTGGAAVPAALTLYDEDNMASDSATGLATQQSIKAYVDAATGGAISSFQTSDGSAAAPSWSFSGDTDSGFYRIGPNNIGLTLAGTLSVNFSTTGIDVTGLVRCDTFQLDSDQVQVSEGGTGSATASGARTNLGLVIGTDVQAYDAELAAIAGLTSAADRLPYFTGSGTASLATFTSFARSILDDADAATVRSTLGLDSMSTQAASSVAITGGSITGITDLAVGDGGTGASTASGARTNLGLAIGSDVQAYNANLAAIGALAVTDSNFIVGNGSTWVAESGATVRTSLGLGSLATLSTINNGNWSGTDLAVANGGTGASTAANARTNLGLVIGTDVQAYDAELAAIAGLTSASNKIIRFTGSGTAGLLDFVDEDNMASDSATAVPSQQSVKAYVDNNVYSGPTLGTPTATTSGTSHDYTSIPSGTKRITVSFSGVSLSGTEEIIIQIGDSGGIETTGYASNVTDVRDGAATVGLTETTGYAIVASGVSSDAISGSITLILLDSSTNLWVASGSVRKGTAGGASVSVMGGTKALSAELDRVRITTNSGTNTFDAGSVNIMYE